MRSVRRGDGRTDLIIALVCVAVIVWGRWGGSLPGVSPAPVSTPVVLIVEETEARTPELATILNGEKLESYLQSNWQGKWRVLDQDADMQHADASWQAALQAAKGHERFKPPWLLVSNGRSGWQGPLPTDSAEAVIAAIKPYEE